MQNPTIKTLFLFAVKRQFDMEMLPLECHYLNKSALTSVVGQQVMPPDMEHHTNLLMHDIRR
jgi:hypothetical protein